MKNWFPYFLDLATAGLVAFYIEHGSYGAAAFLAFATICILLRDLNPDD